MYIQTQNFGEVELLNFTDLTEDDALYVLQMRNHPEVRKWMYTQDEILQAQHFQFVQKLAYDRRNQYLMVKKNENVIGVIYFNQIDFEEQSAVFGLYANLLASTPGVGKLLADISLFYAKNILKLTVLNLEVISDNIKATQLYKKYGFIEFSRLKKNGFDVLTMMKEL